MKTKELIKNTALKLFNERGVMNVPLRDVAAHLKKSYGNITYHFRTKELLVMELYSDMAKELVQIGGKLAKSEDILFSILKAPEWTYDLSVHYLFLFKDYVELLRSFENLASEVNSNNSKRKILMLHILKELQNIELIKAELTETDLDYLMEISGALRTFFFMQRSHDHVHRAQSKSEYVDYTNRLLIPYMTKLGRQRYNEILNADQN